VLVGKMIVGVILAGYDATPQNLTKLIALTRKENATTRAALAASGDQLRSDRLQRSVWHLEQSATRSFKDAQKNRDGRVSAYGENQKLL
jgi:hypothetical protein